MCHLVLSLPIIGLLAFVFLPLPQALGLYVPLAALSLGLFYVIYRDTQRQPIHGSASLVGRTCQVVSQLEAGQSAQYLVRCQGELWGASSEDVLEAGDQATVVSQNSVRLAVEKAVSG